ncbi:MAG: F0F1 ATP synthase subunit A [Cyclonatronaceae bacterium]
MSRLARFLFLLVLFTTLSTDSVRAAESDGSDNTIDILDKLSNHYYLDFKPVAKIELPRILWTNSGILFFSSTTSALNSGSGLTDRHYLENDLQYKKNGLIEPVTYKLVHTDGSPLKLDLSLSSHLVWMWIAGFLTMFLFARLNKRYRAGIGRTSAPEGSFQNIFETLIIFIRDDIALANIGKDKYRQFTPYLLSVFFLILFMNLFGLAPWGVTPTADVSVTLVLALFTFFITQLNGTRDYWKHVLAMPGVPKFMLVIITPVEILGLFTKPFALCVRLFANMAAGKMLIYSIIGLIFLFADMFGTYVGLGSSVIWISFNLFIYALKLFAAFLQAYIFTMFSALFIGMAVEDHDHHGEAAHLVHESH